MDRNKLLAFFDGDENLVDKFVLNFNSESTRLIDLMTGYLAEDNMEMLANCAHILKAQTAYAGLKDLSSIAEQLDVQARSGEPSAVIAGTLETLVMGLQKIISGTTQAD